MKKMNLLLKTLTVSTLLAATAPAQTLVPKWTNTTVFGVNQQYVNDGMYNPATGHLIVCQSSPKIISICSTADGSSLGTLNVTGVTLTGVTYPACGLAVATNGSIYASSYGAVATSANSIWMWANESAVPTQLIAPFTTGAGSVGKTMVMNGSGTNAVFILSSTSTSAVYVYNNAGTWTTKVLTVVSATIQGGMTMVSWSPTSCTFISKNSGGNGEYNTFNPSSASPITVTQTAYAGAGSPMLFVALTGTTTTSQGASGYDPATGLFAFHTRALTASPFTISNYLAATSGGNGLAAPNGCSPIVSRLGVANSGVDTANYGADFWANGVFFCAPAVANTGYGFRAFDISAYKVTDIAPAAATNNIGDTAAFSVVSGGSGTLSYAWKLNGNAITNGGEYSGVTNATLTISPVGGGDAGTYTCTVTGAGGLSWTSTNGVLSVNVPVTVTAPNLQGVSYTAGTGLSLGFTNTPGAAALFTVWASTNLTAPFNQWSNLGHPNETSSGNYQFTDGDTTNKAQQFYTITSP